MSARDFEKLQNGETAIMRPRGFSMRSRIEDVELVTIAPRNANDLQVGDLVIQNIAKELDVCLLYVKMALFMNNFFLHKKHKKQAKKSISKITENVTQMQNDYSSDGAIKLLDEDGLDRRQFAITVADSIAKRFKKPSYVIGLLGAWGCGKTSLKNMILDGLNQLPEDKKPIVVEFNPWQFRTADALFGMFFEQIAVEVGENDKVIADRLRDYSTTLILGGSVAATIIAAAATGGAATPIALALGQLLKSSGEATAEAAKFKDEAFGNLQKQKQRLSETMKELERPVLVVIDDIDRLYAEEIALIFQLVKANADFPNFTYLLLYDQDIVAKSLENKVIAGNGREYLEKIVQFPIDIPQPKKESICQAWIKGIRKIFRELNAKTPEDEKWYETLQAAYWQGLYLYLQNLRDVWRMLNTLEFSLPILLSDGYLDVDVVDFVILTVLRIHEPEVFVLLPLYKAALTGDKKMDIDNQRRNAPEGAAPHAYQVQMETLLQSSSVSENAFRLRALHKILKDVFPDAPWPKVLRLSVNQGDRIDYEDYVSWRQSSSHLAIEKKSNFDRYFVFSLSENNIAESDVEAIIKSHDRQFLLSKFKEWEAQNRLQVWVERIYSSISSTGTLCSDTFLTTWLELGDISQNQWVFRYQPMANNPCFVIIKALVNKQRADKPSTNDDTSFWMSSENISLNFLEVIQKTHGVHLPVQCIELIQWMTEQLRSTMGDTPLVSPDVLDQCRQICGQRIADIARQQELSNHAYVDYLVWFWRKVNDTKAQQWIHSIQNDSDQLFKVLRAWSVSHNSKDGYLMRFDLAELLLAIIPLAKLEELLSSYEPTGTDDFDAATLRLMRKMLPSIREFDASSKRQAEENVTDVEESE